MRESATEGEVVRAIVKAILNLLDRQRWLELGVLTNSSDHINNHERLLRSLSFGDDDYLDCVFDVVPVVLGQDATQIYHSSGPRPVSRTKFPNLAAVEKYLNLPAWLQDNDPALYQALYAGEDDDVVLDELQAAAVLLQIPDVDEHAARIRRGLQDDPAQAIGSSKELLETVLKFVLGLHGSGPETKVEIPKLLKDANVLLGFNAAGHRGGEPGADHRRRLFGSLATIVTATAELRNAGFGTGHGGSQRPALDIATARLVVSSAVAAAIFYIEAHAAGDTSGPSSP
jgi:hypothetical protein